MAEGHLRATQEWTALELLGDPFVRFANGKYVAAVEVELLDTGERLIWYVAAGSAARPLEQLRMARGTLAGVRLRVRKDGSSQYASYEIEEVGSAAVAEDQDQPRLAPPTS